MKIFSIEVQNFRAIESLSISASGYNVFIGPNGVGKSTILQSLNFFFGEISIFSDNDFYNRNTEIAVEVSITFHDLSAREAEVFSHYARGGHITIISQLTKDSSGKFVFRRLGARLVNPDFLPFFELPKTPAEERKRVYEKIRTTYQDLPELTAANRMEEALREFEEGMPDEKKTLIRSEDDFFGVSRGTDKLKEFITWVYVPAVKDASSEGEEARNSHLGRLIQRTVRSTMNYGAELERINADAISAYQDLLIDQQHHLEDLQERLRKRLKDSVTSEASLSVSWLASEKSVTILEPSAGVTLSDRGFSGQVASFGHGLQRAFLLALLQELLSIDGGHEPTLLLGCEEPELYQHPPQAKHLARVLKRTAADGAQVFLTSHSPYFVDLESLEGLRRVSRQVSLSCHGTSLAEFAKAYNEFVEDTSRHIDAVSAKIGVHLHPRAAEIFFADFVVLVEGVSDAAALETYLRLTELDSRFIVNGGTIVEAGGKSALVMLILIARSFGIPHFVIFDLDSNETDEGNRNKHAKDNKSIFQLLGLKSEDAFPTGGMRLENLVAWEENIESALANDFGDKAQECMEAGRRRVGHLKDSKKNPIHVAAQVEWAFKNGIKLQSLEDVSQRVISAVARKT